MKGLVSLTAAAGSALLVPLVMLLSAHRSLFRSGVVAAASWVLALIFG